MKFRVDHTYIEDVKVITPQRIADHRGYFMEIFNNTDFNSFGIPSLFVQANQSCSIKGVVRGLHFQWYPPAGKLMRVTKGEAFLVAVDIRKKSPTLGQWFGDIFSEENQKQLWAPAGFARGICTLSDITEIQYLITGEYNPSCESGINWKDPDIAIKWPIKNPILSDKDDNTKSFKEWLEDERSNNFML